MASGPENTFRASVHKHLLKGLYHVKMNNGYVAGIPDDWYSNDRGDLWVEYKFLTRIPTRVDVCLVPLKRSSGDLSVLQEEWLNKRYEEGRNVAVVVGCKEGGVIMRDQEWLWSYTPQMFRDRLVPRQGIAQWITQQTTR